ncbi:MAG: ABC transporter permease [Propioniciclava sp.]
MTHNLGTVIGFEVRRTLRRPTFWATTLAVPLLFALLFGVSYFGASAIAADGGQETEVTPFTYTDASGLILPEIAARLGGTPTDDPEAAAQAVRDGEADLFIAIPADLSTGVTIVGRDLGLMDSDQWRGIARQLVDDSVIARVGDTRLTDALLGFPVTTELWADGERSAGWGAAVVPAVFVILLFLSLIMLGQQMLNITMEEKENRVSEMILTTINPTALVVGKVIGVVLLGLIQGAVLVMPTLTWMALTQLGDDATADSAGITSLTGTDLVMDPGIIGASMALFVGGFLLVTGLLVAIGSVMPSAKEAGGAFSAVVVGYILPLYTLPVVMQDPDSPLSLGLTLFPLTAPITGLGRLAVGSLPLGLGLASFAIVMVTALAALALGIKLFREGSIAYDQRLSLSRLRSTSRS